MDNYKHNEKDLILRDFLAIDRTKLANERTFLAYLRTFIAFFAAAVGLTQYFEEIALIVFGFILGGFSFVFLFIGIYRFFKVKKGISLTEKK